MSTVETNSGRSGHYASLPGVCQEKFLYLWTVDSDCWNCNRMTKSLEMHVSESELTVLQQSGFGLLLCKTVTSFFSGKLLCCMMYSVFCVNEVTLSRAWLVLGWVTICRRVYHFGSWPATQANSAFYPQWDGNWVPAKVWWCCAAMGS